MKTSIVEKSKYFIRRYIAPGLGIVTGRGRYSRFFKIKDHEWLSEQEIKNIQNNELSKLLSIAKKEVPFYRDELNKYYNEKDIDPVEILKEMRVMKKLDIQENFAKIISKKQGKNNRFTITSGGSTGNPLRIVYDKEGMEKKDAAFMRSLSWGGWNLGDPVAMIWGGLQEINKNDNLMTRVKREISGLYPIKSYRYDEKMFPMWMEFIKENSIEFIYGYATVIYRIAKYFRDSKRSLPKIKAIYSTAETLYSQHRATIEETFKCKVYNQYGSREVVNVASECSKGNMHIQTDMVFVEFLGDNGSDEIRPANIVLTGFTNHVMPFIRYDIEDYGFSKNGLCECGRNFPLMELHIGRKNDHFVKPNGEFIYPSFFIHLLDNVEGIQSFQFKQIQENFILLQYVKDHAFRSEDLRSVRSIAKNIQHQLNWNVKIDIEEVEKIPVSDSGKHRFVVSDIVNRKILL